VLCGHLDLVEDDEAIAGDSASTLLTYASASVKGFALLAALPEYLPYFVL